jgi:beta-glucanase (GH16 family)
MLRDDTTSKRYAAPRNSRSPRASSVVGVIMVVVLVSFAGIFATRYVWPSTTPHPPATPPPVAASTTGDAGPAAFAPPKNWKVKFASDFQGSQIDTAVWGTCYPWATAGGCTNYGNTKDRELEWYQPSQVQVSGGELRLVAQSEPTSGLTQAGAPMEYACRSGMVTTYPSFRFQYGYIQITAMIPTDDGLWPALWLAAANEKWPPEIDILEHWANKFDAGMYLHPLVGKQIGGHIILPNLGTGYHSFGLYWTKTSLAWYYDGQQVFETSTQVPRQSMYFIANLADDVAGPGTCSGTLHIKSVKVWQPPN